MPVEIPLFRDTFWGGTILMASYHGCYASFYFLSGFLIADVRKTQEDALKVFYLSKLLILSKILSMQNNKHKGEIECGTPTNIKYIYIRVVTKY